MTLNLSNYEEKVTQSVRAFWGNREAAARIQAQAGRRDQGERAGVTAGGNMNGFRDLAMDIARDNGLTNASILFQRSVLTLPGFFRPTKQWDMLVLNNRELVAALEFKSQVGPSFGNNFNNRVEEAIGTAHDLWLAYREGAFGQDTPRPFLGWFILVEDAQGSRTPVNNPAPHFAVFPEFAGASYADRYGILCRKLVQEQLYSAASVILSPRSAQDTGDYAETGGLVGVRRFVATFAGHIAAEAARTT